MAVSHVAQNTYRYENMIYGPVHDIFQCQEFTSEKEYIESLGKPFSIVDGNDFLFIDKGKCVYECKKFMNIIFLYPISMVNPQEDLKLIQFILITQLVHTYEPRVLKLLDLKIMVYLPWKISITNYYINGPYSKSIIYNIDLPKEYEWYEYVLRVNQYVYNQSKEKVTKKIKKSNKHDDSME